MADHTDRSSRDAWYLECHIARKPLEDACILRCAKQHESPPRHIRQQIGAYRGPSRSRTQSDQVICSRLVHVRECRLHQILISNATQKNTLAPGKGPTEKHSMREGVGVDQGSGILTL